jgi:hypothetical protein
MLHPVGEMAFSGTLGADFMCRSGESTTGSGRVGACGVAIFDASVC